MKLLKIVLLFTLVLVGCSKQSVLEKPQSDLVSVTYHTSHAPQQHEQVIVILHGLGGSAQSILSLFSEFHFPATIYSLQGPYKGQQGGYSWFDTVLRPGKPTISLEEMETSATKVAQFIQQISKSKPVILSGYSQGAVLSYAVAYKYPQLVKAVLPISGYFPKQLQTNEMVAKNQELPVIYAFHGKEDSIVAYELASQTSQWFHKLGYHIQMKAYDYLGHRISGAMKKDFYNQLAEAIRQ